MANNDKKAASPEDFGFVAEPTQNSGTSLEDFGFVPDQGQPQAAAQPFEMPRSLTQQTITPEKALQLGIKGASASVRGLGSVAPELLREGVADVVPEYIKKANQVEASTPIESAVEFAGGFADPVAVGVNKLVAPAIEALPLAKNVQRIEKVFAQRPTQSLAKKLVTNKIALTALEGAAEFGIVGAAQEGSAQAERGQFDPLELAKKTAAAGALGAVIKGAGTGLLTRGQAKKAVASREAVRALPTERVTNDPAKEALTQRLTTLQEEKARIYDSSDTFFEKNALRRDRYAKDLDGLTKAEEELNAAHSKNELTLAGRYQADQEKLASRIAAREERLNNLKFAQPGNQDMLNRRMSELDAKQAQVQEEILKNQQSPHDLVTDPKKAQRMEMLQDAEQNLIEQRNDLFAQTQSTPEVSRNRQLILENELNDLRNQHADLVDVNKRFKIYQELDAPEAFAGQDISPKAQEAGKKLNAIRERFNQRSEALLERRNKLGAQLEDVSYQDKSKTIEVVNKLRDIQEELGKIEAMQSHMDFVATKANTKIGAKNSALSRATREAVATAFEQGNKVDELKKLGSFSDEQIAALKQASIDNAFRVQGITVDEFSPNPLSYFQSQARKLSAIESATGTNVGQVFFNMVANKNLAMNSVAQKTAKIQELEKQLNKLGYTSESITTTMRYFEPEGFSPLPRERVRGPWPLQFQPNDEAKQLFQQLRAESDDLHNLAVQSGYLSPDQYTPGYVPIRRKSIPGGSKGGAKLDPTFAEERLSGDLDPNVHELNYSQLMNRYAKEVYTAAYLQPQVKQGVKELVKLKQMGQFKAADDFENFLRESFNLGTDTPVEKIFGESVLADNRALVQKMLEEKGVPSGKIGQIMSEVGRGLNEIAYKSLVIANPKSNLGQYLQTEFLLPAEVGLKYTKKAQLAALSSKERDRVKGLLKYTILEDVPALDELPNQQYQTAPGKALKAISSAISEPIPIPGTKRTLPGGGSAFKFGEKNNRIITYLASDYKLRDSVQANGLGGLEDTIKNLLPAEQNYVRTAYQQGGIDKAAQAYGMMVDRRVNFTYSTLDRPDVLRGKLGQYIPFTTFARNIIENHASDLANGKYAQFAKRLGTVLAAKTFYEGVTGMDFGPVSPYNNAGSLLKNVSISPGITGPAAAAIEFASDPSEKKLEKSVKDAAAGTPMGAGYKIYKNIDKTGNPFGLKPVSKNTWWRKLVE